MYKYDAFAEISKKLIPYNLGHLMTMQQLQDGLRMRNVLVL